MTRIAVLVSLTWLLASPVAYAFTGNDMKQSCWAREPACMYFIIGAAQGFDLEPKSKQYCPAVGVTNGQIIDVVIDYMRRHPEILHYDMVALVIRGMREAFPCSAG